MTKKYRIHNIWLFLVVMSFAACGGGQNLPSPEVDNKTSEFVDPDIFLNFTGINGAEIPTQVVSLALTNGQVAVWKVTVDSTWLKLDKPDGKTPDLIKLGIDLSAGELSSGTYSANVTFDTSVGDKSAKKNVHVTLYLAPPEFEVPSTVIFNGFNGTKIPDQSLSIQLNNGRSTSWNVSAGARWLKLDKSTGTTPETLMLSVDPVSTKMASSEDPYSTLVTFRSEFNGESIRKYVKVVFKLTKPTIKFDPNPLILGGEKGRNIGDHTLNISLNTGSFSYPWHALVSYKSGSGWMDLGTYDGMVSSSGSSITLKPNLSGTTSGSYQGTVDISVPINGDTVTASVPVTFNLDAHRLLASRNGISLVSTKTISNLTQTVQLLDNFGLKTSWTATTDQPWLSLTKNVIGADNLTITADPSTLTSETLHFANVTISSSDPTIESTETIRVGLWVSALSPASAINISAQKFSLVTDPIRPYAYGGGGGGVISIYDVYSGTEVGTISTASGWLGDMVVNSDGSYLYALDTFNSWIIPIKLDTLEVLPHWDKNASFDSITIARTNGRQLIFTNGNSVINAESSKALQLKSASSVFWGKPITTSVRGNMLCDYSDCNALDYSYANPNTVYVGENKYISASGRDVAISEEGTLVYGDATDPSYSAGVWKITDGTLLQKIYGPASPNNVETSSSGDVIFSSNVFTNKAIYVYSSNGALKTAINVASDILDGQVKISGDGRRIVALTGAQVLIMAAP